MATGRSGMVEEGGAEPQTKPGGDRHGFLELFALYFLF